MRVLLLCVVFLALALFVAADQSANARFSALKTRVAATTTLSADAEAERHHHVGWNLHILGAAYGRADVTSKVRSLVNRPNASLSTQFSNAAFGDSWPGTVKSATVVYEYVHVGRNGKTTTHPAHVAITTENGHINLSPSKA